MVQLIGLCERGQALSFEELELWPDGHTDTRGTLSAKKLDAQQQICCLLTMALCVHGVISAHRALARLV